MSSVIRALKNGPYQVKGETEVVNVEGEVTKVEEGKEVYLCRCGCSKNKPFCDRSHIACGFKDE